MFELSDRRRDELIELWATRITKRGLATPAVFLLEAHKPLAGFGAHTLLGLQPLLESVTRLDVPELAAFLRHDENVELLIQRIEEHRDRQLERRGDATDEPP